MNWRPKSQNVHISVHPCGKNNRSKMFSVTRTTSNEIPRKVCLKLIWVFSLTHVPEGEENAGSETHRGSSQGKPNFPGHFTRAIWSSRRFHSQPGNNCLSDTDIHAVCLLILSPLATGDDNSTNSENQYWGGGIRKRVWRELGSLFSIWIGQHYWQKCTLLWHNIVNGNSTF